MLHQRHCETRLFDLNLLKTLDTFGNYLNYSLAQKLGNDQWRAVDNIKHCEKRHPMKQHSFWERGNFSLNYFNSRKTSVLKPFSGIWKHTNLCSNGIFLFNFDDKFSPNFLQVCYNVHMLEYFESYQTCSVPLKPKTFPNKLVFPHVSYSVFWLGGLQCLALSK